MVVPMWAFRQHGEVPVPGIATGWASTDVAPGRASVKEDEDVPSGTGAARSVPGRTVARAGTTQDGSSSAASSATPVTRWSANRCTASRVVSYAVRKPPSTPSGSTIRLTWRPSVSV